MGSIKIAERPEDDVEESNEISPFHWCVAILGERAELEDQAAVSFAKIKSLEQTVGELKDQLAELIKAKEDDETQLLGKFRDLLNEKKVKIRQQQRLLASVDVDPQASAQGDGKRKAKYSRPSKRKIADEDDMGSSNDDQLGHVADTMDVDSETGPLDPEGDEQTTTDEDEDKTQDEASTGGESEQPKARVPKSNQTKPVAQKKSPATPAQRSSRSTRSTQDIKSEPASQQPDDVPPAKRELPFIRKTKNAPPAKTAPDKDDDETGSDDEL